MKRTDPKSLASIIDEAIAAAGIRNEFDERRACFVWADVVGPGINRLTTRRYVEHGVLHVYIVSAPLKNELSFCRARLVELINKAVGSDVIKSIEFH